MAKTAKIAQRTRAFGDNLAGLDARTKRSWCPDWVVGVIAWVVLPTAGLLLAGLGIVVILRGIGGGR